MAAFSKLSKTAKRIAIAKHALKMIKLGKFIPMDGVSAYSSVTDTRGSVFDMVNSQNLYACPASGVRDLVNNPCRYCIACAMGMLQTSLVLNDDTIDYVQSFTEPDQGTIYSCFTRTQRDLIERDFERDQFVTDKSSAFCIDPDRYTRRAQYIFRNIVRNKGTYVPPKMKEYR